MSTFNEEICVETEDFKESEDLASVTIVRSNTVKLDSGKGKIVKYKVNVKVRDSKDFDVELSRADAERIFGLYTYYGGNITARNVANEFPRFTLSEIKKIFRAFKLTKDSAWFPPHMLEEMNEEQLANYRMNLKERARKLKKDIPTVFLCLKDRRTPVLAKLMASLAVFQALSAIDLIPDFIPVLGYLDDVIILPFLIYLTVKLIPEDIWKENRDKEIVLDKKWKYAIPIIVVWILIIILIIKLFWR